MKGGVNRRRAQIDVIMVKTTCIDGVRCVTKAGGIGDLGSSTGVTTELTVKGVKPPYVVAAHIFEIDSQRRRLSARSWLHVSSKSMHKGGGFPLTGSRELDDQIKSAIRVCASLVTPHCPTKHDRHSVEPNTRKSYLSRELGSIVGLAAYRGAGLVIGPCRVRSRVRVSVHEQGLSIVRVLRERSRYTEGAEASLGNPICASTTRYRHRGKQQQQQQQQ